VNPIRQSIEVKTRVKPLASPQALPTGGLNTEASLFALLFPKVEIEMLFILDAWMHI
jgi:hypothetical protein